MKFSEELLKIKNSKKTALFMPYLTLGDPSFSFSLDLAKTLIDAGAHLLELGIPFSDPTADGPIIQKAMVRAFQNNDFSLSTIFQITKEIHLYNQNIFLIYLTYFNPIFQYNKSKNSFIGETFLKKSVEAGIKGFVIPDLPFDSKEFLELEEQIQKNQLPLNVIPMIAPNTNEKRTKMILSKGSGFVYYITSLGVTGFRDFKTIENYQKKINFLKQYTNLPIFAGFGIHRSEQAKELKNIFDGIIVGSLFHKIIDEILNEQGISFEHKLKKTCELFYETTKNFVDSLILN